MHNLFSWTNLCITHRYRNFNHKRIASCGFFSDMEFRKRFWIFQNLLRKSLTQNLLLFFQISKSLSNFSFSLSVTHSASVVVLAKMRKKLDKAICHFIKKRKKFPTMLMCDYSCNEILRQKSVVQFTKIFFMIYLEKYLFGN